jgi:hypothetical protein
MEIEIAWFDIDFPAVFNISVFFGISTLKWYQRLDIKNTNENIDFLGIFNISVFYVKH